MKKCRECKTEIASDAKRCPHCKAKQGSWFGRHPIWTVLLVLFVIGLIGSAASGGSKSSTTSNSTANTQNKAQADQPTNTETVTSAPNVPAEYVSALNKATTYANTMHMSKRGVYDQLVSAYGEKFSAAAAQYAIDHVQADWNANALAKAETYQKTMSMSLAAIHDQLTSDAGEKFTQAEADYAIQHLSK